MGLEIQFKAPKEPIFAVFSKIGSLKAYFTSTTHLWTHFYDPCHRRCCLRHFRGIASLGKIFFVGLEVQFNAQKDPILGILKRNRQFVAYFTFRNTLVSWAHFHNLCHGKCCLRRTFEAFKSPELCFLGLGIQFKAQLQGIKWKNNSFWGLF